MQRNEATARAQYILGGYEILDTIGNGGMGIVYRARDLALNRPVALKVLQDDLRAQPAIVARFQREAEAAATLNHPNIVHVYSVGASGGIPYIAMEFVDGVTLSEILRHEERIEWPRALRIGRQIACALNCAHNAQVIHRDIKPGNVLIDPDDRAYVTDFGIAKVLWAATQLTVDGTRLGTPQYMCPERYQNRPVSYASDLYSLGVLLFQTMSSCLPFDGENAADFARQILRQPAPRLKEFAPDIPDAVDRLVAHLLERDPAARPASAQTVVDLIDRALNGEALDDVREEHVRALAKRHAAEERDAKKRDTTAARTPASHNERTTTSTRVRGVRGLLLSAFAGATLTAFVAGYLIARPDISTALAFSTPAILPESLPPMATVSAETNGVFISHLAAPGFTVKTIAGGDGIVALLTNGHGESAIAAFEAPEVGRWLAPPAQPLLGQPTLLAGTAYIGTLAAQIESADGVWIVGSHGFLPSRASVPPKIQPKFTIAPDKAGRPQVFGADGAQKTFLEQGVGSPLVAHGEWHVAPAPGAPGLIWVR